MMRAEQLDIRAAASADLDAIAILWHDSAVHMEGAPSDIPSMSALRQRIDAELAAQWTLHACFAGDRLVAMLALKLADAIVDQLFVRPSEQGRGIGPIVLDFAKQAMPGGFTLHTQAGNTRARRFYESGGLTPIGEHLHPRTGQPLIDYAWLPSAGAVDG